MAAREAASDEVTALDTLQFPVAEGEEPWTLDEIAEVRAELEDERQRMSKALNIAEAGLHDLLLDASDGAGRDPADVGSTNFERDQEMSLAANAREMLDQIELAMRLIDTGQYGRCENCGKPIGKGRLMVFPRATKCVACKQREERR